MAKFIETRVTNYGAFCEIEYTYDDGTTKTETINTLNVWE